MHVAPKPFLLIALNALGTAPLTLHLVSSRPSDGCEALPNFMQCDQIFVSHKHQPEDGLPNFEEFRDKGRMYEDNESTSSVVRSPPEKLQQRDGSVVFTEEVSKSITFAECN